MCFSFHRGPIATFRIGIASNTNPEMTGEDVSTIETRKRKWKQNLPNVSNVNSGLFDDLQILINSIDLLNEGVSNDYRPVADFFRKGLAVQCSQGWSYYAQVNEHTKFAETTVKLTKLIAILNSDASVLPYGSVIIRDILNNYSKVLYRGINNLRPSITNAVFRLMTEIVQFNKGQFVDEFLQYFDLTLLSLLKVLNPRKVDNVEAEATKKSAHISMRTCFIKFWIALIKNAPSVLRKDIMTDNQKIMTAWMRNLVKMDSSELIEESLHLLIDHVLKETSFKKMTKCKILNEFVASRLHELYYSLNKNIVSLVDEFFQIYGGDLELGVVFIDKSSWFEETQGLKSGVLVEIHQKSFKLHNKLLYTALTFFKPWEDDTQCNTVIKILATVPELVAPYSTYISSMGSHYPKMTAYWFGMTLFLGRLINLPIPEYVESIESDNLPSNSIVIESIIPSSITKAALTKCLQHESNLIKQMGCQLLVFSLKKLDSVVDLYHRKGWESSKAMLLNTFFSYIPDLPVLTNVLNTLYTTAPNNKILALSLTLIFRLYSKIFPNFFNISLPSSNFYVDIMKGDKFSGIDLVMLDNFMKFQELNSSQIKWWHASNKEHSLFSSLLRLASSKNASSIVASKISQLLHNLLQFSIIFTMDNLTSSPLSALINSLLVLGNSEEKPTTAVEYEAVWKLLDESIARCQKTPYKYVDMAKEYENISPFLAALAEQWKFVKVDNLETSAVAKWLVVFFRNMIVLGTSKNGAKLLLSKLDNIPANLLDIYLSFEDSTLKETLKTDLLIVQNETTSFYDHLLLQSSAKLATITRVPVNPFDVSAIVFRLNEIQSNSSLTTQTRNIIDNLLSKIGNYALGDLQYAERLVTKQYFSKIITELPSISNGKHFEVFCYVLDGVQQIFSQLGIQYNEFKDYAFDLFQTIVNEDKGSHRTMALQILSQIVSKNAVIKCLKILDDYSDIICTLLLQRCLDDKIHIQNQLFIDILESADINCQHKLQNLLVNNLVEDMDVSRLVQSSLDKEPFFIQSCMHIPQLAIELSKHYKDIKSPISKLIIATHLDKENDEHHILEALKYATDKLYVSSGHDLFTILTLLSKHHSFVSENEVGRAIDFVISHGEIKYTSEAASFVLAVNTFSKLEVKTWLNKLFLYITKYFAEKTALSEDFLNLLVVVKDFMKSNNSVWKDVKYSILNAQLEVILSGNWIEKNEVLEYITILLLCANKKFVNANSLFQVLLNNNSLALSNNSQSNYTKFLTSSALHQLYFMDVAQNSSTTLQKKLLELYHGYTNTSDIMLLAMLESIESTIGQSWTNNVISWEFVDTLQEAELDLIGPINLITSEKEGLIVTISKDKIIDTLNNFPSHRPALNLTAKDTVEVKWNKLQNFFFSESTSPGVNVSHVYDPMFILLCAMNNEELVRKVSEEDATKTIFNVKRFIDTGLLQLAIASLGLDATTVFVSKSTLEGILYSIKEANQFKDRRAFEVLVTRILYTLEKQKDVTVPTIIWISLSRLCDILIQPSSDLYEKAYRWVLMSPMIKDNDIPLLQTVFFRDNDTFTDSENYYKYLSWLLQTISLGLKTPSDVKLLKMCNFFEWLMNLENSSYLHIRLKTLIQEIFYTIQQIDNGEGLLISGYASIAFSECERVSLSKNYEESKKQWLKNTKNNRNYRNMLVKEQQLLNNLELSTRRVIIAKSDKRLSEWMNHDELNVAKRICR